MNQTEFVESITRRYKQDGIVIGDPDYGPWDDAHYPVPECLGGTKTIPLMKRHHAIQGVLQSIEFNHPCVWGWETEYLENELDYLLPEHQKWMQEKSRIAGTLANGKGGRKNVKEGLGYWKQTEEEWAETCRKGGETAGRNAVVNKTGIHIDDPEKRREWAGLGGQKAKGKLYWNNGVENKRSATCPGEGWVRGIITNRWKNKQ